jgi:hypothetical protein
LRSGKHHGIEGCDCGADNKYHEQMAVIVEHADSKYHGTVAVIVERITSIMEQMAVIGADRRHLPYNRGLRL